MPETTDIAVTAPVTDSSPSSVSPPTGTGGGVPPAQGTPPQQSDNIRQLREAYDGLKAKYEPWDKLGVKPEQVTQYSTAYNQVRSEAVELGKALGYPENEVEEAIHLNAAQALFLLRQQYDEAAQQQGGEQDIERTTIEQWLQEKLTPIQQWKEQAEQRENINLTNEANAKFERTVHQLATEMFKKEGVDYSDVSEDEKYFITAGISELLKYNEQGLRDLKYNGKTAAIQEAARDFFNLYDKAYLARQARVQAKIAPARGANPAVKQEQGKPSLDEMIENPALINAKYK